MKNNIAEHGPRGMVEGPSSGGSALSNPPQHAFSLLNSHCMWFQGHDIKSGFIVVAAGATLLATAALAIRHFFRTFTWRKDLPVGFPNRYGTTEFAGVTPRTPATPVAPPRPTPLAPISEPASVQASDDVTHVTSPIDPSEAPQPIRVLASEELLDKDWNSQEDDTAWANL